MRPLKHWKVLILQSNMLRTIYEPGLKCDHWNIESYWSSDQICRGQYLNLGANVTIKMLKAIDHLIKYATDNIWTWAQMGPWKHWKLLIIRSNMPWTIYVPGFKWDHGNIESYWSSDQICHGQYMNLGSNATIETLKAIDHQIKYATDNIYEPEFRWDHWNIESYWSSDLTCHAVDNINEPRFKCNHWNIESLLIIRSNMPRTI